MRMRGATWIGPTTNETPGGEGDVRGVVVHIQDGNEQGTEAWQRNPAAQVSSHFLCTKSGSIRQMVDTADKAWCEVAGNAHWLSIENEGYSGQALTAQQVTANALILAWAHYVYRVPLVVARDPWAADVAHGGLGYHSLGGAAWGGHYDCPGTPIIAQLPGIVAIAGGTAPPPPPPPPTGDTIMTHLPTLQRGSAGDAVRVLQGVANVRGAGLAVDGSYGPLTTAAVTRLQEHYGITRDGVCGPHTWSVLLLQHDYA